jgi:hypothetical protein
MRLDRKLIKEIVEEVLTGLEEKMAQKRAHDPIETDEYGETRYSPEEQEANLPGLIERRDAVAQQTEGGEWELHDASTKRLLSRETFIEQTDAIDAAMEGGYAVVAWYDHEGFRTR